MSTDKRQLLINYRDEVATLSYGDDDRRKIISRRGDMLISNICGDKSKYLTIFHQISFAPCIYPTDEYHRKQSLESGKNELIILINAIIEHEDLFGNAFKKDSSSKAKPSQKSNQVFIVHGHDESAKSNVARFVEKLGLKSIVMHEQANKGKTVIEKLEEYVPLSCFAIVLLTADDVGYLQNKDTKAKPRARQNVIFELGFCCAALDRKNVCVLYEEGVEIPNNYAGVVYIILDKAGAWQRDLAKEMKSAGIDFDMNKIAE